jgi:hypothetical protein
MGVCITHLSCPSSSCGSAWASPLRHSFVQGGHKVIEIETVGSCLEYCFGTTEGIRL